MKLRIQYDFSLEVGDDKYTGTFTDLTKKQIKEVDKLSPKKALEDAGKINAKIARLNAKIDNAKELQEYKKVDTYYAKLDTLEGKLEPLLGSIEAFSIEYVYKARLELSIGGDDKEKILEIADEYGYKRVFETIMKDIADKTEGN